jgi:predicted amidohydrolase YtcJ
MHSAVNRTTRSGVVLGTGQRSAPVDALKAITSHGAYVYFEEKSKGTIAPGKRADLVVLSRNPLEVPRSAIKDIRVLKTIKDGLLVYDATSSVVLAAR